MAYRRHLLFLLVSTRYLILNAQTCPERFVDTDSIVTFRSYFILCEALLITGSVPLCSSLTSATFVGPPLDRYGVREEQRGCEMSGSCRGLIDF